MFYLCNNNVKRGRDRDWFLKKSKVVFMKKKFLSVLVLVGLAGCSSSYDYYNGDVRYTQDGDDCVFYSMERGRHYSEDIRTLDLDKKIVYRNTRCADLYARDNGAQNVRVERAVIAPVTNKVCDKCEKCKKRKYVFVK